MARSHRLSYLAYVLLLLGCITLTLSHPYSVSSNILSNSAEITTTPLRSSTQTLRAGQSPPQKIEPPAPKFKTTPDKGMPPELDLNVLAKENLSAYDDEALTLTTTRFMPGMYQTRIPVGNGYFGTTVAAAGPFYEKDVNQTNHNGNVTEGWPLFNTRQTFATLSGFWDSQETTPRTNFEDLKYLGRESIISGVPYPLAFNLVAGGHILNSTVDKKTITDFTQTWDLKNGQVRWSYVWSPKTKMSFEIDYITFMARDRPNVGASKLRVTPRGGNYNVTIIDLLDGRSAERSHLVTRVMVPEMPQIYVGVHPEGLPSVTAFIVSTANVSNGYTIESSRRMSSMRFENGSNMTISQEWDVQLVDGETAVFTKFIGVASSDKFEDPETYATGVSKISAKTGWDTLVFENTKAWNELMKRNLMTDYRDPATGRLPEKNAFIEALQAEAVVDRFISLINLLPENGKGLNDVGISPVGLSADSYGGMIFWDQDLWTFPAIAATNPDFAIQIPNSRVKLYEQARANAQMSYVKEKYNLAFDNESAVYPWMNGRFGNATATGPAVAYQYHLNTDIAFSMLQMRRISGNEILFRQKFWPVIKSVGHSIANLLEQDNNGGWSIFHVTDPDEYAASVDNGAYVLASMSAILHQITSLQEEYGEKVNQTWIEMANTVNIPRATSGITQEYANMPNNVTVKQADVPLIAYPWHNIQNYTLEQKRMDLAYYTQKQNPDGPAMTYVIYANIENQIAESGCAAPTYHHKGTIPYLRAPWFLMSEVPNDDVNGNGGVPPAFPFVTGHGGAAQIPLFGYLGWDLTQNDLTVNPSLPPPFLNLQPPDFHLQGARFRAAMNSTHTSLTRLVSHNTSVVYDAYEGYSMAVIIGSPEGRRTQEFHTIAVNETLIIDNDMYWKAAKNSSNIVQCQPTTSKSGNVLGQFPGAATDGNPATRWQPLSTKKSNLFVDTSAAPFQIVKQINLDWGARPPRRARVGFTNSTNVKSLKDSRVRVVDLGEIKANQPYRTFNETEPVAYVGNTTEHVVKGNRWASRGRLRDSPVWTGKYAILEVEGCNGCGTMNAWSGGDGTRFNPQENNFGATVGEFEIIGANGTKVV